MYTIYSLLLFFSLVFYIPVYYVKQKLVKKESLHLCARLGFNIKENTGRNKSLWIHAVSVGEVLSLQNLVTKIKGKHPDWSIYFSTLTSTGMQVAREKMTGIEKFYYVPLDFKSTTIKFFSVIKPDIFIVAESEIWPNLLREAKRRTRGVILINGRMSDRSFKRYKKFWFFMKDVFNNIDLFLVQTDKEKGFLEKLGIDPCRVETCGNLKSEICLPLVSSEERRKIKKDLNISETKKMFLAGSTRKGEEDLLLSAFVMARRENKNLLLVIAPRHLERVGEIEIICEKYSLIVEKKTSVKSGLSWDVLILDTLGELAKFYSLSDVAFIGGSLVPWGGQNLLEPAFYEKPVYFGPHMENFAYLAEKFVKSEAACVINGEEDLIKMFLCKDKSYLKKMGKMAKLTLNSLQGTTERTLKVIEDLMAFS